MRQKCRVTPHFFPSPPSLIWLKNAHMAKSMYKCPFLWKKQPFFMLFGHSEGNSGRQSCWKIKKKSLELGLSKEVLFAGIGVEGRKVAPTDKSTSPFLTIFGLQRVSMNKTRFPPNFTAVSIEKTCLFYSKNISIGRFGVSRADFS